MSNITNWDEIVKKEARGINDYDLGEVHEVDPEIVVTKKGHVDTMAIKFISLLQRKTPKTIGKTNSSLGIHNFFYLD